VNSFAIGGIDPGKKGYLVILGQNKEVILVESLAEVRNVISALKTIQPLFVLIEKQMILKEQGIASSMSIMRHYGELLGILQALDIPFQEIHPSSWKKQFSLLNKTKAESIATARRLFPQQKFTSHDLAEAFLLAELAYRMYLGGQMLQ